MSESRPVPASPREPAVVVRDLVKRFGDFVAVDHLDLEVGKGEIFGFLGPNGAGKSTTIRMLCGIVTPTSGTGSVAGFDLVSEPEKIKANIGYMSQKFSLYDDLTIEENLDFYGGIYGLSRSRREERKDWVLEMAGLTSQRRLLTGSLPVGWKQRLSLGASLLHEPPIVFLDEPTSGVDPISRRRFWDVIHELSGRGVTVFVTTHYMDEAEYCERLGLIYRGKLVALGSPTELKSRFMEDSIVEITCDRLNEAMARVEGVEGVKEVAIFGRGLHAVVENAEGMPERIERALASVGCADLRVEAITPSLEDVFVSLIERSDRTMQPAGEVSA
jgi:ABC-2 type transport system ATP-binding protein